MTAEHPAGAHGGDPDSVLDDDLGHRLTINLDSGVAELVYRVDDRHLTIVHTEVPEQMRGRGIGGRLVRAALERAEAEGLSVVPLCPYARKWLRDHPEQARTVSVDWRE